MRHFALVLVAIGASLAHASTVWTGPLTNYVQSQPYTLSDPNSEDTLTARVVLTRDQDAGIYNVVDESSYDQGSDQDPSDTEWAVGSLDNYASLSYSTWAAAGNGHPVVNLVGEQLVLHLKTDDIYMSVLFTELGGHGQGGFAYMRSTPAASSPTPTVSITNPASGAVFAAPATIALGVSASVSSGTITNVTYFTNGLIAGSATAPPFSLTLQGVHVASYALTAVATAAGVSATSAVVNISVEPPPSVSITNPAGGAVFAAPANVRISAVASVVRGAVTNVSFFLGSNFLGSASAAPFSVIATNLSANAYALTAVATAAGLSTTSAVVSISVVNPVPVTNTQPKVANGQFSFDYNANPGLTYVLQSSSNLVNWISLSTNVASSGTVQVTNSFVTTNSEFYRVSLAPNPQ